MRPVDLRQPVNVIMEIDLGCLDIGVPHKTLKVVQVNPWPIMEVA